MAITVVMANGQLTIPESVRADLGLEAGSRVEFVRLSNGRYEFVPETPPAADTSRKGPVTELKGILRKPRTPVSIEDMNEAIADEAAKADDDRY